MRVVIVHVLLSYIDVLIKKTSSRSDGLMESIFSMKLKALFPTGYVSQDRYYCNKHFYASFIAYLQQEYIDNIEEYLYK